MNLDGLTRDQLLSDVINLISGTVFVMIGLVAFVVSGIRRRTTGVRAIVLLGMWSVLYGSQRFNDCSILAILTPPWMKIAATYVRALDAYLVLVVGFLTFRELTLGAVRRVLSILASAAAVIAVLGLAFFVATGDPYRLLVYNQWLATLGLFMMLPFLILPSWRRGYSVLRHPVLLAGYVIFVIEALLTNLLRTLGHRLYTIFDDSGFLAFILAIGYVSMERIYSSERRLTSIENELAVARQLQFSILPTTTPEVRNLRIAAVYEPMTAVAGDFYEFLTVDDHRAGFLVADVSGHGVPAALIASMIKVAVQSVLPSASDPSALLVHLRDILSAQLQGQFVSAAYLWIDSETRTARYSAAGHPPLIRWRASDQTLARIESNGLLFGVPFDSIRCPCAYPAREIPFAPGDRFLLYTDGLTEPENASGEAFGDRKLEQILRNNPSRPAAELSLLLLSELRAWQSSSTAQQDDITFLIIDVL